MSIKMKEHWFRFVDKFFVYFDGMFKEEDDLSKKSLNYILFNVLVAALGFGVVAFSINVILILFTEKGGVFGDFFWGGSKPYIYIFNIVWLDHNNCYST